MQEFGCSFLISVQLISSWFYSLWVYHLSHEVTNISSFISITIEYSKESDVKDAAGFALWAFVYLH